MMLNKTSFSGHFELQLQSGKSFHLALIPDVDTSMTYAKRSEKKTRYIIECKSGYI